MLQFTFKQSRIFALVETLPSPQCHWQGPWVHWNNFSSTRTIPSRFTSSPRRTWGHWQLWTKVSQKLCHGQWALPGLAPWLWTWTMVGMDEFTIQPLRLQGLMCLSKRDPSIRETPLCSCTCLATHFKLWAPEKKCIYLDRERTMKFITQFKLSNYFFQT